MDNIKKTLILLTLVSDTYAVKMSPNNYNYGAEQNPVDPLLRRPSLPFISGDTFRFFSDHKYDEAGDFNPLDIKKGDTIYVSGWYLKSFFENKHPHITQNYILISGNSDIDIDDFFIPYLNDSKLVCYFANNVLLKHDKLIAIPIGIANSFWPHGNIDLLGSFIKKSIGTRYFLLTLNFDSRTNQSVRGPLYDFFTKKKFCRAIVNRQGDNKKNYETYLNSLKDSYFIISPFGNGVDCYRVWEACLLGCIPIVQSSTLDELYSDLPILIVDNFFEIDEEFLWKKNQEIRNNIEKNLYNMNKLYFKYWHEKIKDAQFSVRKN